MCLFASSLITEMRFAFSISCYMFLEQNEWQHIPLPTRNIHTITCQIAAFQQTNQQTNKIQRNNLASFIFFQGSKKWLLVLFPVSRLVTCKYFFCSSNSETPFIFEEFRLSQLEFLDNLKITAAKIKIKLLSTSAFLSVICAFATLLKFTDQFIVKMDYDYQKQGRYGTKIFCYKN